MKQFEVDPLATAFPEIGLREIQQEREAWRRDPERFWEHFVKRRA